MTKAGGGPNLLNALNGEAHSVLPDVQLVYSTTKSILNPMKTSVEIGAVWVVVLASSLLIKLSNLSTGCYCTCFLCEGCDVLAEVAMTGVAAAAQT